MITGRFWEQVGGLLALGMGLAALILSRGLPQMEGGYPGPSLFPGLLGLLLIVSGLGVLRWAEGSSGGLEARGRLGSVLAVLLSLGLAPILLGQLGLVVTGMVYTLWASLLLRARWWEILVAGGVVGLFVYWVFLRFLGVQG